MPAGYSAAQFSGRHRLPCTHSSAPVHVSGVLVSASVRFTYHVYSTPGAAPASPARYAYSHMKPASIEHVLEHPSPSAVFPSSHASPLWTA